MNFETFPSYGGLKSRTGTVLNTLIGEYISTVTPVASEDIARRLPQRVSPATIRSEMAGLEEEGYITRPHVSAGGIPSDKGYRFYVESLAETDGLPLKVQEQIREQFRRTALDQEAWIQLTATVLAQLTDNLAIVTFPRSPTSRLKSIDLVYLQEFLALMVIVLEETKLRHQFVPLEDVASQTDLSEMAVRLNETLRGLTSDKIDEVQMELSPLGEVVKYNTAEILREADAEAESDHCVDGLRLLLDQPEFSESRRAHGVVEILEERVLLRSLLSEVPEGGNVGVYIGKENPEEILRPYGIIIGNYGIPQKISGTISVIGPPRMEYANVIGSVRFLSSFLSDLIIGVHGNS